MPAPWALCGGWAVDAWVGHATREHLDVDVVMLADEQAALRDHFTDGWLLLGHDATDDESETAWNGRRLVPPAHVHVRGRGLDLDVQLNDRHGDDVVLRHAPRLAIPAARYVRRSPWGLLTLAPELVLLYKADGEIRAHDEADFRVLAPRLEAPQRAWLRAAIADRESGHPWLAQLSRVSRAARCR